MAFTKLIFFLLCSFLLSGCIDKQREEEEIREPLKFLTIKESRSTDAITKIEGFILNHAQYTAYGNIRLLITYYSHQGHKIGSEYKEVYEVIAPGSRQWYSFDITPPPHPQVPTNEITVDITHAFPWLK